VCEVILAENNTLMQSIQLNKQTKVGVKMFKCYQVITFYVLDHFCHTLYTVSQ